MHQHSIILCPSLVILHKQSFYALSYKHKIAIKMNEL